MMSDDEGWFFPEEEDELVRLLLYQEEVEVNRKELATGERATLPCTIGNNLSCFSCLWIRAYSALDNKVSHPNWE